MPSASATDDCVVRYLRVCGLLVSREAKLGLGRTKDTSVYKERRAESGEARARAESKRLQETGKIRLDRSRTEDDKRYEI